MTSSAASSSVVTGLLESPVIFPNLYLIKQYIALEVWRHYARRSIAVPNHLRRFSNSRNHHPRNTAAGTWRKRWKHWEWSTRIQALYGPCKDEYILRALRGGRKLSTCDLRFRWRRGGLTNAMRSVAKVAFFSLDKHWSHLWPAIKRRCWPRKEHFEMCLLMRHSLLAGWHHTEVFSI